MNRQSLRKLHIKCVSDEAFGLYSVVANPRSVTPYDVKAASQNIALEYEGKKPSVDIVSLVNFVLAGFFAQAHRSGLYNRQRELWDAIARVSTCQMRIVKQGVFVPIKLPVVDIDFLNSHNEPIILARLVKPQNRRDLDKRSIRYLQSFFTRINRKQNKKGSLTGAFICIPQPVSLALLTKVQSKVGASDPANRFDSRLPLPANIPFNVLEMDYSLGDDTDTTEETTTVSRLIYPESELFSIKMVHPDLTVPGRS
ncbi:MAG: hypothetical protein K2X93_10455 [Candidatus Obscuribacterales bacterium]|nr:hypothetical protein [Candidatus Obscuribacterales bacterium]